MSPSEEHKSSAFNRKYFLLYIPSLISLMASGSPVLSYFIAWAGSFFIFYLSFTNKIKNTHTDTPFAEKVLRPLFLMQIIFAGYMSCSSIFNFMDLLGYEYFTRITYKIVDPYEIGLTAGCQRYYLLGHAALVHGMLVFYSSDIISPNKINISNWPAFFIKFGVIAGIVGLGFSKVGGLSILGGSISGIAFVASTIGFALSIPLKKTSLILIAALIFGSNLLRALTSGFKEPVIVSFLMLGLFLYPFYKKIILTTFVPLMLLLFAVLPTYVNTFRSYSGGGDAEAAKAEALQKVREQMNGEGLAETNWEFLRGRISEIGLFVKYKENVENGGRFYGFEILGQTMLALVPRILWKDKPVTENMVNVRVIENGIINDEVNVSAKPQYIVDSYLSFGVVGVWIFLFLYGAIAQLICNKSEKLFGGYLFGVAFVFTGMMGVMWRGNCFEFIFNSILYGYLALLLLYFILNKLNIVEEKR
ncbi:MAG: hypothetical protein JWR72_3756 [Flavisolibacter sp.]|jgi:hypothetical protein|nr:hypothetical protein [Flavisolibacter sp.]